MTSLFYPTYDEIHSACKDISNRVNKDLKELPPQFVVYLIRGGMVPAVILAHNLKIDRNQVIGVSYSSSLGKGEQQQNSNLPKLAMANMLLVDDICDSGHSMLDVKTYYQNFGCIVRTAALYYKENAIVRPDYYWRDIPSDSIFVNFPWEIT